MLISVETPDSLCVDQGKWLQAPYAGTVCYERTFSCTEDYETTLHMAVESDFLLRLDGQFAGRGRMHATQSRRFLESFLLKTGPGMHQLSVTVFDYGELAPRSQISLRPGFFCLSGDGRFNTGFAAWNCRRLPQYRFEAIRLKQYHCVGGATVLDNRIPENSSADHPQICEKGIAAERLEQADFRWRRLAPCPLPPFPRPEITDFRIRCIADGGNGMYPPETSSNFTFPLSVPPGTKRRILLEFKDYECLNLTLCTRGGGGSKVTMSWSESLFDDPEFSRKGDRRQVGGKFFHGLRDVFYPGIGLSEFTTPHYRAGRFLEILAETGTEALTMEQPVFREDRYPLAEIPFPEGIPENNRTLWKCAVRTLEMCCHDTVVDCPYYEQLPYIGDGRLMLRVLQDVSADLRLNDHMLLTWSESTLPDGRTTSFAPSRTQQYIPGYSLIFVLAVCDRLTDPRPCRFARTLFRAALRTLLAFEENVEKDGLLHLRSGWCFMDWAAGWTRGVPPMSDGISGSHNALYLYTHRMFETLCRAQGEKEFAERFSCRAESLASSMRQHLYDRKRGLYRETPEGSEFSEQCGALMILAGETATAERLFASETDLVRCSLFFDAYYLQAALQTGNPDAFSRRLNRWQMLEPSGLLTLPETEEPSRSDCHGWYSFILRLLPIRWKQPALKSSCSRPGQYRNCIPEREAGRIPDKEMDPTVPEPEREWHSGGMSARKRRPADSEYH